MLDNLERGHRRAVPPGAKLVVADLLDREAVDNTLAAGFDGAMHFASAGWCR